MKCVWKRRVIAVAFVCLFCAILGLVGCDSSSNGGEETTAHTHEWGEWQVAREAICTEDGVKECLCACGEKQEEAIPALGHTEATDAAVAPTCTETGLTEGKHCSVCETVLVAQETVEALGHTEATDAAVAPTCTETGLTEGKHCAVCETVLVAQETVEALGHAEVTDAAVAPTCTETGLTEGKHCSVCETVLVAQETVESLGHTEVIDAAVNPTCTETGLTEGKHCSVCETVLVAQETVEALGHTEVIDAAVAPTCTETGLTEGKHCSVCETVLVAQEIVEALGHTEVIDASVNPTCTETGLTEGKHCSVCETVLVAQEIVEALGHTEVIDAAVNPTCTETGLTEGKHCSVCETVLVAQELVVASGHARRVDAAVSPTCTEDGLTEGSHCGVCGTVLVAQEIIPAAHTEVIDEAVEPTCTKNGATEGKHCSVCEDIIIPQEVLSSYGHIFEDGVCTVCAMPEPTPDSYFTYTELADGTYAIAAKDVANLPADLVIPYQYRGQFVTQIVAGAFSEATNLVSVIIPDSVTTLGALAFKGCGRLVSVVIPNSVTTMGDSVFSECGGLISVTIGNGLTRISDWSFANCTKLMSVVIPDCVTSIGEYAFYNCWNMGYVAYVGTETEWNQLLIGDMNDGVAQASLIFNYDPAHIHTQGEIVKWASYLVCAECGIPYDRDRVIAHMNFDELDEYSGENKVAAVFRPGHSDGWDGVYQSYSTHIDTLRFWGWVAVYGELGQFGYCINGGDGVFDDAWTVSPEAAVINTAMGLGAATASRMEVMISLQGIRDEDKISVLYRTPDGVVVILRSFTVNVKSFEELEDLTVSFVIDGFDQVPATQTVKQGYPATRPADSGAQITWYTSRYYSESTVYDFTKPVTNHLVLYGRVENPEPDVPVNVFKATDLSNYSQSMNIKEFTTVDDAYVNIQPSSSDPYFYPFKQVSGARYVAIRYRSSDATGADLQIYLASSGSAPTDDTSMLSTTIVTDGEWQLAILDTQSLIDTGIYDGEYVSYFRLDPLEAGYMLDENGQPYKPDGTNYARYELPEGCSIDVAYVGFFHSVEAAEAYDSARQNAPVAMDDAT